VLWKATRGFDARHADGREIAQRIATGIHYPIALPNLKAYSYLNHRETDFPEASKASHEVLSLPMFPELEENQIRYVAQSMKEFSVQDRR
jgi:dTDP-4-amino-4,6-dideoxygalactose transaminase